MDQIVKAICDQIAVHSGKTVILDAERILTDDEVDRIAQAADHAGLEWCIGNQADSTLVIVGHGLALNLEPRAE